MGNKIVTNKKTEGSGQRISNIIAACALVIAILALVNQIFNTPINKWVEGDIRRVIEKEAALTRAGDFDGVMKLYLPDANIRDEAGGNQEKAKTWIGLQEIRGRYDQLVQFKELSHDDIIIMVSTDGEYATAVSSTTGIYELNGERIIISSSSSDRGEEWTLKKVGGSWKIKKFTYNLP